MPATPSLLAFYILQLFTVNIFGGYQSKGLVPTLHNFLSIAANRFDHPYNSWGEELYDGYDEHRKRATNWARVTLLFHTVLVAGAFAIGHQRVSHCRARGTPDGRRDALQLRPRTDATQPKRCGALSEAACLPAST